MSYKMVGLILLPIYTRYLSPEEYGLFSLILIGIMLIDLFAEMGVPSALFRFLYDCTDQKQKNELLSTTYLFVMFISLLTIGLILLLKDYFIINFFPNPQYQLCFYFAVFVAVLEPQHVIAFHYFRAEGQVKKYCIFNFLRTFLLFTVAWFCLTVLGYGILSPFIARIISSVPTFVYLTFSLIIQHGVRFSFPKLKEMFSFGFPFFIVGLLGVIMSSIDKPILLKYMSLADVGIYSVAFRVASGVKFLIFNAFSLGWSPVVMDISKQDNSKEIFAKFLTYYLLAAGFVVLGVSLFAKDILTILVAPKFIGAYTVIPLLCLAHLFYGIHSNLEVGIFIKKKSRYYLPILGGSSVTYIILNFLFIPKLGFIGAGLANALSFLVIPLSTFLIGRKMYKINYEYSRIIKIFATLFLTYFLGSIISFQPLIQSIAKNSLFLLVFPILLFLSGFFKPAELAWAKKKMNASFSMR